VLLKSSKISRRTHQRLPPSLSPALTALAVTSGHRLAVTGAPGPSQSIVLTALAVADERSPPSHSSALAALTIAGGYTLCSDLLLCFPGSFPVVLRVVILCYGLN